jgi:hypothetical protein
MDQPKFHSRYDEKDQSLDVWIDGWKIHFPAKGEISTMRESSPEESSRTSRAGEVVKRVGEGAGVGWRGRLVLVRAGEEPQEMPPEFVGGSDTRRYKMRVRMYRHGDR